MRRWKKDSRRARLPNRGWRFIIVNIGIERFIHTVDVNIFHYASFTPLPTKATTAVQFLRGLSLRLVTVKVERTRRDKAGAGECLERELGKACIHSIPEQLIRLLIGSRRWAIQIKVVGIRGKN